MNKSRGIKATILMFLMVGLVIGYYFYLSSKNEEANSNKALEESVQEEMTVVQELLARAPFREYPSTPVQVVKYYNEITQCFYNETITDEELEELAKLCNELYDVELAANQSYDQYISRLRDDIGVFHAGNITIYKSEVTPATDVEYFTYNGYECAKLYCMYTLKSGTVYQSTREVFILRKDSDAHWKIYGFDLAVEEDGE